MIPGQFELVLTADKSPSFQQMDHPNQEWMHHSGGAYTETQYIYGEAIRLAFKNDFKSFVSVGLGLGYNELLIACEARVAGLEPATVSITSYEINEQLRADFLAFVNRSENAPKVYSDILAFFIAQYGFSEEQILNWLKSAYDQGRWQVREALSLDAEIPDGIECCLFDAFSAKTSPELWNEEFFEVFLRKYFAEKSIFATYARTGILKRSLIVKGFILADKTGFGGRKESTLASRNLNASAL